MNILELIGRLKERTIESGNMGIFSTLEDELTEGLMLYWKKAENILEDSGVKLLDPPEGYFALENNFFSAIFLYSYYRADIQREKRILYSAMNQCLRGMVTGCDNLLDDEYKMTLLTSLPEKGTRFRSVLDIMVSDRVLFELSLDAFKDKKNVIDSSAISLRALIQSGFQEATEEGGIREILEPDRILDTVHHYKTGILFNCPWAIPSIMENIDGSKREEINKALYNIGMGCQIMDDIADIERDLKTKRHNYVISLIYHDSDPGCREYLESIAVSDNEGTDILLHLKDVKEKTIEIARLYLTEGLNDLFGEKHRILVEPAIEFLAMRIGVEKYF